MWIFEFIALEFSGFLGITVSECRVLECRVLECRFSELTVWGFGRLGISESLV